MEDWDILDTHDTNHHHHPSIMAEQTENWDTVGRKHGHSDFFAVKTRFR
jgi:hypothetical protein